MTYGTVSEKDAKEFGRKIRKWTKEMIRTGKAEQWLIDHGFLDKKGKLAKRYR